MEAQQSHGDGPPQGRGTPGGRGPNGSATIVRFDDATFEDIQRRFREGRPKETAKRKRHSRCDLVYSLHIDIEKLLEDGYSFGGIAEYLAELSVDIPVTTLKNYVGRARRRAASSQGQRANGRPARRAPKSRTRETGARKPETDGETTRTVEVTTGTSPEEPEVLTSTRGADRVEGNAPTGTMARTSAERAERANDQVAVEGTGRRAEREPEGLPRENTASDAAGASARALSETPTGPLDTASPTLPETEEGRNAASEAPREARSTTTAERGKGIVEQAPALASGTPPPTVRRSASFAIKREIPLSEL